MLCQTLICFAELAVAVKFIAIGLVSVVVLGYLVYAVITGKHDKEEWVAIWSLEVDATNGEGLRWNFDTEPESDMPDQYGGQVVMYSGTWNAQPMYICIVISKVDAWTTRKHEEEE